MMVVPCLTQCVCTSHAGLREWQVVCAHRLPLEGYVKVAWQGTLFTCRLGGGG
jgi:hypothetical protein